MVYLVLSLILLLVILFCFLPGAIYKHLIAFVVMSNLFDMMPNSIPGTEIKMWDIGFVLMVTNFAIVIIKDKKITIPNLLLTKMLGVFISYLLLEFLVSILVYDYPFMMTIKASRYLIGGFFTFYIFIFFFLRAEKEKMAFINTLYVLMFLFTALHIIQYLTKIRIFYGYQGFYKDYVRAIPIFIPITFLFMYRNLIRLFVGCPSNVFNIVFIILSIFSILITFTRGLYLIFLIVSIFTILILVHQRAKISYLKVIFLIYGVFAITIFLTFAGVLDKFIDRAEEGIEALSFCSKDNLNTNTFAGRIYLVRERIDIIFNKNIIIGLGFIHEKIAHDEIQWKIGSRDRKNNGKLHFFSGDIAWGNLVAYIGFGGICLFIFFILSAFLNYFKMKYRNNQMYYIGLAGLLAFIVTVFMTINASIFSDNRTPIAMMILAIYVAAIYEQKNNRCEERSSIR